MRRASVDGRLWVVSPPRAATFRGSLLVAAARHAAARRDRHTALALVRGRGRDCCGGGTEGAGAAALGGGRRRRLCCAHLTIGVDKVTPREEAQEHGQVVAQAVAQAAALGRGLVVGTGLSGTASGGKCRWAARAANTRPLRARTRDQAVAALTSAMRARASDQAGRGSASHVRRLHCSSHLLRPRRRVDEDSHSHQTANSGHYETQWAWHSAVGRSGRVSRWAHAPAGRRSSGRRGGIAGGGRGRRMRQNGRGQRALAPCRGVSRASCFSVG